MFAAPRSQSSMEVDQSGSLLRSFPASQAAADHGQHDDDVNMSALEPFSAAPAPEIGPFASSRSILSTQYAVVRARLRSDVTALCRDFRLAPSSRPSSSTAYTQSSAGYADSLASPWIKPAGLGQRRLPSAAELSGTPLPSAAQPPSLTTIEPRQFTLTEALRAHQTVLGPAPASDSLSVEEAFEQVGCVCVHVRVC